LPQSIAFGHYFLGIFHYLRSELAEAEAAETQVWFKFAVECDYLAVDTGRDLYETYNQILGSLVNMINKPENWLL
jgi:four helix bundle protein